MEQGSDLTGGRWTTNAQYLRAGGSCNSMLRRRKSSTDDEYHHEDPLGVFGVITGANGAVLSSYVYDAFMGMQYVPLPSKHPAKCYLAMSEPNMLTGSGGRGVVVHSRGFHVMGNQPAPVKKHPCKIDWYKDCMDTCKSDYDQDKMIDEGELAFLTGLCLGSLGTDLLACAGALLILLEIAILNRQYAHCRTNCLQCKLKSAGRPQMPGVTPCDDHWQQHGKFGM